MKNKVDVAQLKIRTKSHVCVSTHVHACMRVHMRERERAHRSTRVLGDGVVRGGCMHTDISDSVTSIVGSDVSQNLSAGQDGLIKEEER